MSEPMQSEAELLLPWFKASWKSLLLIFCQILWIFDDFIEGAVDCGTLKNHQICQKFGKKWSKAMPCSTCLNSWVSILLKPIFRLIPGTRNEKTISGTWSVTNYNKFVMNFEFNFFSNIRRSRYRLPVPCIEVSASHLRCNVPRRRWGAHIIYIARKLEGTGKYTSQPQFSKSCKKKSQSSRKLEATTTIYGGLCWPLTE